QPSPTLRGLPCKGDRSTNSVQALCDHGAPRYILPVELCFSGVVSKTTAPGGRSSTQMIHRNKKTKTMQINK
ncbi:MAG: hypothetical protein ABJO88_00150, partial [Parasphingorhabdus sp.]